MNKRFIVLQLLILLFAAGAAGAQNKPSNITQVPSEDFSSIDNIIDALYDVISGPAGKRDWKRMQALFKPEAKMAAFAENKKGQLVYILMTPEDYQKRNEEFFLNNGFWEEEIGRNVFRFGEMATIQSAYQFRLKEDGEPQQRGVNSIQLVYDQGRWWITNLTWNAERTDNPIPEDLFHDEGHTLRD